MTSTPQHRNRAPEAGILWHTLGHRLALLALVAAPLAATAQAPATPADAPSRGEAKAIRDFQLLDFNGDGKLSRAEVKLFPRLAAAFDEADTDKDGFVSFEEVRTFAAQYRAERERNKTARAAGAAAEPAKE